MSTAAGPPRWMLFCEAAADFRTIEALVDELARLWCGDWVRDALAREPLDVRHWWHHEGKTSWYDSKKINDLADELDLKRHQGHFGEKPRLAGAVKLDTVFRIVRKLHGRAPVSEKPSAVMMVWDADDQPYERRAGLKQALEAGFSLPDGVAHVVALADPEREAWVLAGFDPQDAAEEAELSRWRATLGYAPHLEAHRLSPKSMAAKNDSKKVLGALCPTHDREQSCLRVPHPEQRAVLVARGEQSGLKQWIIDVEDRLLPQVDPAVAARLREERAP